MKTVTKASLDLLVKLARDAGNWSGTPMLDITKEEKLQSALAAVRTGSKVAK